MSNAFLYRCPAGIAGDVTRRESAIISAEIIDADVPVTVYGVPVNMVSGKIQPINADSEVVYGFLVRPYPAQGLTNEALATATPSLILPCDVMRKGYMTVKCENGTPTKNAPVYVAWDGSDVGKVQMTQGGNEDLIPNCYFTGVGDSDGNVEISFGIANA
jgi:hypothetical protein